MFSYLSKILLAPHLFIKKDLPLYILFKLSVPVFTLKDLSSYLFFLSKGYFFNELSFVEAVALDGFITFYLVNFFRGDVCVWKILYTRNMDWKE